MNFFKDKKGGEKIFSIWWFFILAITGGGIIIGVATYASADIDVRGYEAKIMNDRIYRCLVGEGLLNYDIKNFDIFSECNFDKKLFDNEGVFFFRINLFDADKKIVDSIKRGDSSFEETCEFQVQEDGGEGKNIPKCFISRKKINYLDNSEGKIKSGVLEILTSSNQAGKKISIGGK